MTTEPEETKIQKAKYDYLGGQGCFVVIVAGGVCGAAGPIMATAFETSNAIAGTIAVIALAAMAVGVSYFLMRDKDR